jgi:DNA-binding transcriptional regulator LsrR (DeoR family)
MRQIINIMRLKYEAKLSNEKVARACGISKGVVSKYLQLAADRGLAWPLPEDTDEAQLERLLFPATPKPSRFAKPVSLLNIQSC